MKTFKDLTDTKKHSLREKFYLGSELKIGQIVEDVDGVYEILDRGTNYITVVNSVGDTSKKFFNDVILSENSSVDYKQNSNFSFKGYVPSEVFQGNTAAVWSFSNIVEKYEAGSIVDSIAILKALKSVDILIQEDFTNNKSINTTLEAEYEKIKVSLKRIGEWDQNSNYINELVNIPETHNTLKESMATNIKQSDKLKIASAIAETLGSNSSGSSAENIVNAALRTARKNSMMLKGESFKIILRMLELAKSVGIDYDENIIKVPMEESLSDSATASDWISDFVNSTDPKFDGKSKEKRKEMALAAYYAKNEETELEELSLDTLRRASAAKRTVPPKSIDQVIRRFGSAQRTQDKLHTAELKRISDDFTKKTSEPLKTSMTYTEMVAMKKDKPKLDNDEGTSLGATSDTNRMQMVKKLKDL